MSALLTRRLFIGAALAIPAAAIAQAKRPADVARLINAHRIQEPTRWWFDQFGYAKPEGFPEFNKPLVVDPMWCDAAGIYIKSLVQGGVYFHDFDLIIAALMKSGVWDTLPGQKYYTYGETLAFGVRKPEDVEWAWEHSLPHHETMCNPYWSRIGVGVANGDNWAALFGY